MYAQTFWIGANISMGANISWARIFHGREYFMGANIFYLLFRGHEPIYFTENKEKTLPVPYDRDTHSIEYMN